MARFSKTTREEMDLPKAKLSRDSLREAAKLFAYLHPYRGRFMAALCALWFSSLLSLAFPYFAGSLIDSALPAQSLARPHFLPTDINAVALCLLAILALQASITFFHSISFARVGQQSLADLRRDTYTRLIRLPMTFFAQRRVGELSSRISADLSQIEDTLISTIPQFIRHLTLLLGGIALIAFTSGKLTLVMLSSLPPLMIIAILFGRKIRRFSREAQDRLADSGTIVEETLQGITNVKAFANESYEIKRYGQSIQNFLQLVLRGARYRAAFISFVIFALFGVIVFVLWFGSRLLQQGEITVGELTRFILYTTFVAGAMGQFADLYSQIQKAVGATERVRELLHEKPEIQAPSSHSILETKRLRGEVIFDQVSFNYPSRAEVRVLKEVSFRAQPGERVALVGPSGGGKSTIISLLLRFYEPGSGQILIDGNDARHYALPALRNQMAIVPQEVLLFGGSIAENIAYGKPGASQPEILEAARKANAHEFITGFPEGYETLVGERGIKLSGGQRQRVAIARAILKDPAILILDEATSSLDSQSERLVQDALDVLMEGRTTLIIAHRLATIRSAHRIIVIKDGQTVESGTHEELQGQEDGLYRRLSELQFDLS
jgi:ATP-binding cassette subfamily B protein